MPKGKRTIVCLCGSTRFYQAFQQANYQETMAGKIVLTVGFYPHAQEEMHGEQVGITPEQKTALDDLHLDKIDLAEEVIFLNQGDYLGESSKRELAYSRTKGKHIRWMEWPSQYALAGEEPAWPEQETRIVALPMQPSRAGMTSSAN